MDEFVRDYLNNRFSLEEMVAEWAYNLHDACQRYAHNQPIGLFGRILTREVVYLS